MSPILPLPHGLQGVDYDSEDVADTSSQPSPEQAVLSASDEWAMGREVHYVIVAAKDSPQSWKDAADFVCDWTNDRAQIFNAIELATTRYNPETGEYEGEQYLPIEDDPANITDPQVYQEYVVGGVLLSPGRFVLNGSINIYGVNYFGGSGAGTLIVFTDDASFPQLQISHDWAPAPYIPVYVENFGVNMYNHPTRTCLYHDGGNEFKRAIIRNVVTWGGATGINMSWGEVSSCAVRYARHYGIYGYDKVNITNSTAYNCGQGVWMEGWGSTIDNCHVIWYEDTETLSWDWPSWLDGPVGIAVAGWGDIVSNCLIEMDSRAIASQCMLAYDHNNIVNCTFFNGNGVSGDPASYDKLFNKIIVTTGDETLSIKNCWFSGHNIYGIYFDPWRNQAPEYHGVTDGGQAFISGNVFSGPSIGGVAGANPKLHLEGNVFMGRRLWNPESQRMYCVEIDGATIRENNNMLMPDAGYMGLIKRDTSYPVNLQPQISRTDLSFDNAGQGIVFLDPNSGAQYRLTLVGNQVIVKPAPATFEHGHDENGNTTQLMSVTARRVEPGETLLIATTSRGSTIDTAGPSGSGWEEIVRFTFGSNYFAMWRKTVTAREPETVYTINRSGTGDWLASLDIVHGIGDLVQAKYNVHSFPDGNTCPTITTVEDGSVIRMYGFMSSSWSSYGPGYLSDGHPHEYLSGASNTNISYGHFGAAYSTGVKSGSISEWGPSERTDSNNVTSHNFALSLSFAPKGTAASSIMGTGSDSTYDNDSLYLTSPDGTRYLVTVDNNGNITTNAATANAALTGRAYITMDRLFPERHGATAITGTANVTTTYMTTGFAQATLTGTATEDIIGGPETLSGPTPISGSASTVLTGEVDASRHIDWSATASITADGFGTSTGTVVMTSTATISWWKIDDIQAQHTIHSDAGTNSYALPTIGVNAGDTILFWIKTINIGYEGQTPDGTGWTQHYIHQVAQNGPLEPASNGDDHVALWSKTASGTEADVTITPSAGSGTEVVGVVIVVPGGAGAIQSVDIIPGNTTPDVAGTANKPLVAIFGTLYSAGDSYTSAPTGMTELSSSSGSYTKHMSAVETLSLTGPTGGRTVSGTVDTYETATAITFA